MAFTILYSVNPYQYVSIIETNPVAVCNPYFRFLPQSPIIVTLFWIILIVVTGSVKLLCHSANHNGAKRLAAFFNPNIYKGGPDND